MKTLGMTGLMPEKMEILKPLTAYRFGKTTAYSIHLRNELHDQLSALDLLTIVKKALELKLIVVKKCPEIRCAYGRRRIEYRGITEPCPTCSGNGFTITEGE